ncbi:MAG: ABC transporter ATP-binding protein [Spirochaetales bacterium]|nr:ABC transporter ATP-binding protein [Spirochaetales bacterium]
MIRMQNVSKTYASSGVKALDGINLEIKDGEIFGFLGPNGAGKTTAIKIITGIINADEGNTLIDMHNITSDALAAKKRIGYVTDNPDIFARLKAREYLNFIADVFDISSSVRQQRISDYCGRFEIEDVLNASIGSFSHGMKQKLLIAASLLADPQNWILDEPIIGLDPKASFILKEIMRDRADRKKCVFFSTHVMEIAERICDRLAIIDGGKIVFSGTLKQLQNQRGKGSSLEELFLKLTDNEVIEGAGS